MRFNEVCRRWIGRVRRHLSRRYVALGSLVVLSWGIAIVHVWQQRDFYDDAFIYCHMAMNVVERWNAQYFPVSGNIGLLASSPFRLLSLIPSALISRIFGIGRTLIGFKFMLVGAAIVTSSTATYLLWAPLKKRQLAFLHVATIPALLVSFDGALQMESLLAFSGACLAAVAFRDRTAKSIVIAGTWLAFSRIELGVAFAVSTLVYVAATWQWRLLRDRKMWGYLGLLVVGYVVLCASWRVWPIPTTFLTKILSKKATSFGLVEESVGTRFLRLFQGRMNPAEATKYSDNFVGTVLLVGTMAYASWRTRGREFAWSFGFCLGCLLLVSQGGQNFVWYFDNLFALILGLVLARFEFSMSRSGVRSPAFFAGCMGLIVWAAVRASTRTEYPLVFTSDLTQKTMGNLYARIGRSSKAGNFSAPDGSPYQLETCEVGAIAFFSTDRNLYFQDACSLVHSGGELLKNYSHPLHRLYPSSALPDFKEERQSIVVNHHWVPATRVLKIHWGVRRLERCVDYGIPPSGKSNICLAD